MHCYEVAFGLTYLDIEKFFTFSPVSVTKGHAYKLYTISDVRTQSAEISSLKEMQVYGIPFYTLSTFRLYQSLRSQLIKLISLSLMYVCHNKLLSNTVL